jgi:DNA-binding transcriptional LysR family regulator
MLMISLDALQIIDAIDRRGSFSAAGKALYKVPSTISYTVAKLEQDLGVQLFERLGPKVALTAAGAELLREGRHLLRAAADLELRVRRVASGWETEFALGLDSLFAPDCLSEDIAAFYAVADRTRLRRAFEHLYPMAVARQQQRQRLARRAVADDADLHPLLHRIHWLRATPPRYRHP